MSTWTWLALLGSLVAGWTAAVLWHRVGHPDGAPWGPVHESRRRRQPATCTLCRRHVVRWVYASRHGGRTVPDDARCQDCGLIQPVSRNFPSVDYHRDIAVTVGMLEDDVHWAATMLPPQT